MVIILKFLKLLGKIIVVTLYSLFAAFCTVIISYTAFLIISHSFFTDNGFNFQIILFLILALLIIFIVCFLTSYKLPSLIHVLKMDTCIDTGICPEGIKWKNDEGVLFEINKENCLKYGYKWYDSDKECYIRKTN